MIDEPEFGYGPFVMNTDTFLQQQFLVRLRWIRIFDDIVFIVVAIAIAWQVVIRGLWRKRGARA